MDISSWHRRIDVAPVDVLRRRCGRGAGCSSPDFAGNARIREIRDAWLHLFANLAVVLIEGVNLVLRLPDPDIARSFGIVLSAAAALVLLFSGWKGGELVFRHGVGQIER